MAEHEWHGDGAEETLEAFRRAIYEPREDSPMAVTFYGPELPPDGVRMNVPIADLRDTSYVCTGTGEPYEHYRRRPHERVFDWVGHCNEVPGPHAHPGAAHGHG